MAKLRSASWRLTVNAVVISIEPVAINSTAISSLEEVLSLQSPIFTFPNHPLSVIFAARVKTEETIRLSLAYAIPLPSFSWRNYGEPDFDLIGGNDGAY